MILIRLSLRAKLFISLKVAISKKVTFVQTIPKFWKSQEITNIKLRCFVVIRNHIINSTLTE